MSRPYLKLRTLGRIIRDRANLPQRLLPGEILKFRRNTRAEPGGQRAGPAPVERGCRQTRCGRQNPFGRRVLPDLRIRRLAPDRGVRSLTGNLCGGAIDNRNNTTITPKRPPAVTATKALTGETSVVSILTSVTVCRHDWWPLSAGFKKSMRRAA
jgi:hypothetical protein